MAVSFPDTPVLDEEFSSSNRTWIWDGNVWLLKTNIDISVENLNDVDLTNLSDGEALLYNATTQKWENGAVDALPSQSGNAGYFLTTDGTNPSWSLIDIPSTTVSEAAPTGAEEGDTWFRSSTGQYFVYYDSFWVEVGAGSTPDLSDYYTISETDTAISSAIQSIVGSAPETLDTLNEIANAIGNDDSFIITITNSVSEKKKEINEALSADATLVPGHRYFVDTSATRTLTLPATPSLGDEIQLFDAVGTGATNNVAINNNSEKINGVLDSAIIDIDGFATVFVYTGSAYGWRMI